MWIALLVLVSTLLGIISAVHAVMRTRTAQGAIAWAVSLVTFPYLAVPLYWVFGRRRFHGYREAWRERRQDLAETEAAAVTYLAPFAVDQSEHAQDYDALRGLSHLPVCGGNEAELLVDGHAAFDNILEGIRSARKYVLVQFYIVRDDGIGRRVRDALVAKAKEGVEVYLLYDELGSSSLPSSYVEAIRAAGGHMTGFRTTQGRRNRFQLNFRNHRKIVVVDGEVAWIGGLNVGDEYMGLDERLGDLRDTHMRLEGPAVLGAQASYLIDWYWATRDLLRTLDWSPEKPPPGDKRMLVAATGPADQRETAKLIFIHAINSARKRLWIATPYFVPDPAVFAALEMAALRGVEVRVLTPEINDSRMVQMTSYWFIQELDGLGIDFMQYKRAFMHQKVMLVDDNLAIVGTHNFDSRSFVLNFEVSVLVDDVPFAGEVAAMLERDFTEAEPYGPADLKAKPLWFQFLIRLARLTAPIQ